MFLYALGWKASKKKGSQCYIERYKLNFSLVDVKCHAISVILHYYNVIVLCDGFYWLALFTPPSLSITFHWNHASRRNYKFKSLNIRLIFLARHLIRKNKLL